MKSLKLILYVLGLVFISISCAKSEDKDEPQPPVVTPNQQTDSKDPKDPDTPSEPDKDSDEGSDTPTPTPTPPSYPTFDKPNWSVTDNSSYENSMTAYITLPDSLLSDVMDADEMAVFCNSVCRATAERIEVSPGEYIWIAYIYGNTDNETLTIKYYSSKTSHMYNSENTFPFQKDKHYGNIDNPQVVGMKIRTE